MPITIRELAKRANLSITTVSRALDGYPDVAEATRQRVIRLADEMGYVPSRAARQLRRKRADAIGYIMPTSHPRFADPFFSEFIAGLGDETASHNLDLLVSLAPPGEPVEREIYHRWVQSGRVDGLVLSRMRLDDWRAAYLHDLAFPFAAFGGTELPIAFPHIGVDGKGGIQRLVGHLVARGHRRIAFIAASPTLTLNLRRYSGYQAGLEDAGLSLDAELVVAGNLTLDGGYSAAQRLLHLGKRPTAIIGANDLSAIGAMRAAHELGFAIPDDLAVAGFDNIAVAEHALPPLTTLSQPVYEIARQLVRMLKTVMDGGQLDQMRVTIEPELVVRASTGG